MRELARSRAKTLDCGEKASWDVTEDSRFQPDRPNKFMVADSVSNEFESASKHASGNNDQDKEGHTHCSRTLK